MEPLRPDLRCTRHVAAAGHYLAAHAAFQILEAGGNAIDAGVAGGLALGVVQSELVNVAGVAPIIIYLAETKEVVTISGLGVWPKGVPADLFQREHGGTIPPGILRTVVPAAPDAWITALERYGTMRFGEVAAAATRFAREGFVMYPLMAQLIANNADGFKRSEANAAIYLPDGAPPKVGELFVQADLGRTLQYMADQEATAAGSREDGLRAARDAFYKGDIAQAIVRHHAENGGYLTAADMAEFSVAVEPPEHVRFAGTDVYACGPWCQGPSLLQALSLLDPGELKALGHNSADYVHRVAEALKLSFADRERYYGDPRFVDVPMRALLSDAYAAARRTMIRDGEAWPGMPPAGDPYNLAPSVEPGAVAHGGIATPEAAARAALFDTSHVSVVDAHGNAFAATPSDTAHNGEVVPGTGICPSSRGSQNWADPSHPSGVAPGKRPRLTPNPALAIREGEATIPFGTPGGDVQCQAMLQAFVNLTVFDMTPQAAVEAPRFATHSFPNSFEPHGYTPGVLSLEGRIDNAVGKDLERRGHTVDWWPDWIWSAGAMCLIESDQRTGIHTAGADPRRPCYAVGW